jgi:hypothetical protein
MQMNADRNLVNLLIFIELDDGMRGYDSRNGRFCVVFAGGWL